MLKVLMDMSSALYANRWNAFEVPVGPLFGSLALGADICVAH